MVRNTDIILVDKPLLLSRRNHSCSMFTHIRPRRFDARNSSTSKHRPRDPTQASRVTFNPKPPAALTIIEAADSDSGDYECRVDFATAPSRTTKLTVCILRKITDGQQSSIPALMFISVDVEALFEYVLYTFINNFYQLICWVSFLLTKNV